MRRRNSFKRKFILSCKYFCAIYIVLEPRLLLITTIIHQHHKTITIHHHNKSTNNRFKKRNIILLIVIQWCTYTMVVLWNNLSDKVKKAKAKTRKGFNTNYYHHQWLLNEHFWILLICRSKIPRITITKWIHKKSSSLWEGSTRTENINKMDWWFSFPFFCFSCTLYWNE